MWTGYTLTTLYMILSIPYTEYECDRSQIHRNAVTNSYENFPSIELIYCRYDRNRDWAHCMESGQFGCGTFN